MPFRLALVIAFFAAFELSKVRAADAKTGLGAWTAFSESELSSAGATGVQIKTNGSMGFERGFAGQAVYLVEGSVEAAVKVLDTLDPTRFPELEVFQQRSYRVEADAHFSELEIDAKAAPFQRLLGAMSAPKDLQLNREERAGLPSKMDAASAQSFWAKVLHDRWAHFAQEGQVVAVGSFDPRKELRSLLVEEPKIAAHFTRLLQPWTDPGGNPGAAATEHYWDVSSTENQANFELGAIFKSGEGETRQVADVTYYSSSSYIVAISLFEFIPIPGRATPQTLVWHGTMLSSAEVAGAFGLKRKFAIRTLESEMRQWIGIYRRLCTEAKK